MSLVKSVVDAGWRGAGSLLSRGREGRRLVILHYHRVPDNPDPMCPDVLERRIFAMHMQALADVFTVVPLGRGLAQLRDGSLPPRAVAITFDDGYADNYQVALPVLQQYQLPAAFFVATAYLDGGCMFNDLVIEACRAVPVGTWSTGVDSLGQCQVEEGAARVALANRLIGKLKYLPAEERRAAACQLLRSAGASPPEHLMMTSDEVRGLHSAGMEIGGHTVSHPILARLEADEAAREIRAGKEALESLLRTPVSLFAYPNGKPGTDYLPRDVELTRLAGFDAALTTVWASTTRHTGTFEVPRIGSWDRSRQRFCARLMRCYRELPGNA
jgi:peptidoglycan/xylan/chitin deacetylase (PgdA/CDA1 family)